MATQELHALPSIEDMLGRINQTRERMDTDEDFKTSLTDPNPSGNPISLGRRIPTPEEMTRLQIKGAKDNAEKWLQRTTNPKKNFKEEAMKPRAAERFNTSMQTVIEENLWQGGMANVNESEALAIVKAVGASGYSKAVKDREAKILRVHKELDSDRLALASVIDELPNTSDDEREEKMIANKRGLQAIGKKRRGVS